VMLEHPDQILHHLGLVVVAVAGGEQGNLAGGGATGAGLAPLDKGSGAAPGGAVAKFGQAGVGVDAEVLGHQLAGRGVAVHGVDPEIHRRDEGDQLAEGVGAGQQSVPETRLALFELDRLGAEHQVGKVHIPGMGRDVGALGHVAQVAQVALVHHLDVIPLGDAVHLQGVGFVHQVEQGGEGVAQAHAAAAAVADVKHPLQFPVEGLLVVEVRAAPVDGVAGGRVETAFSHATNPLCARDAALLWLWVQRAPWPCGHGGVAQASSWSNAFWKRLAWLRSALARVSNQSAISSKPSSRAVFAMPGYMSVYSWVSPAMAALRLLAVPPMGRPVAGSPTASRYSRWPWAWPVSPSAVERNTAATSL